MKNRYLHQQQRDTESADESARDKDADLPPVDPERLEEAVRRVLQTEKPAGGWRKPSGDKKKRD